MKAVLEFSLPDDEPEHRYAIDSIRRNDRFSSESGFPASENAGIAENQSESTAFPSGKDCTETVAK